MLRSDDTRLLMPYSVTCECSKVHQVTTGDAGVTLNCSCGRPVEVPSLSVLRRDAGEFTASPELIIESMLRNNELPENSLCVQCHTVTENVRYYDVVCERAELKRAANGCIYFGYLLLFGWVGAVLAMIKDDAAQGVHGRNINFRLPLRICSVCNSKRIEPDSKELLCQVPVYAHLFLKYPHARITDV
jgi:hypothetical protein